MLASLNCSHCFCFLNIKTWPKLNMAECHVINYNFNLFFPLLLFAFQCFYTFHGYIFRFCFYFLREWMENPQKPSEFSVIWIKCFVAVLLSRTLQNWQDKKKHDSMHFIYFSVYSMRFCSDNKSGWRSKRWRWMNAIAMVATNQFNVNLIVKTTRTATLKKTSFSVNEIYLLQYGWVNEHAITNK